MQVQVHLYTVLREKIPSGMSNPFLFTVKEKSTIQDLLDDLNIIYNDDTLAIIVNGKRASVGTLLSDGNQVDLVTAISGGSSI
jgi:sulfur carrier protein ThiS